MRLCLKKCFENRVLVVLLQIGAKDITVDPIPNRGGWLRETVPLPSSDLGKKTVSVLAHSFLLPQRANSVYILSITPLRYSRI